MGCSARKLLRLPSVWLCCSLWSRRGRRRWSSRSAGSFASAVDLEGTSPTPPSSGQPQPRPVGRASSPRRTTDKPRYLPAPAFADAVVQMIMDAQTHGSTPRAGVNELLAEYPGLQRRLKALL